MISAFPDTMLDRGAIRRLWQHHLDGVSNNARQLYMLASFGLFRRQILSQAAPQPWPFPNGGFCGTESI